MGQYEENVTQITHTSPVVPGEWSYHAHRGDLSIDTHSPKSGGPAWDTVSAAADTTLPAFVDAHPPPVKTWLLALSPMFQRQAWATVRLLNHLPPPP